MKKDNKIDQLLAEWGRRQRKAELPKDDLTQRISQAVRRESVPFSDTRKQAGQPTTPLKFPAFGKVAVWGMAATALFIVGLLVIPLWLRQPEEHAEAEEEADVVAQIAIEDYDAREKRIVMDEINALFGADLVWFAEDNGRIMIELADERNHKPRPEAEPVLLKMLLLRRSLDSNARETLWQGNIISKSEQLITVSSIADDPDNTLTLWLFPVNAAGILVDFELDLVFPAAIKASSSNHLLSRRPLRVLTLESNGHIYEMHLSAASLKDDDKHPELSM